MTSLVLIQILLEKNVPISELCDIIKTYPQVIVNAKIDNSKKDGYDKNERIEKAIKELENEFKDCGRVVIRPSGTEPLIRVMIEGEDEDYITKKARELGDIIEAELN